MTTQTDRSTGLSASLGAKAPCLCATVENTTLYGLQTIDGVALSSGDRVLVHMQDNAVENGIWVASTAAWTRAADFDGSSDVLTGTIVLTSRGTSYGNRIHQLDTLDPVIGTTALSFALVAAAAGDAQLRSDLSSSVSTKGDALVAFKQSTLTGATARTVHTKLADSVSVKDFGAVGDGTTDDTDAFIAAISACANASVYIPAGTYILRTVTISVSVEIYGPGTVKLKNNYDQNNVSLGDTNAAMFDITTSNAVVKFIGITFNGNQANQSAVTPSLSLIRAWNRSGASTTSLDISVVDCTFMNQTSASIRVNGVTNADGKNILNVHGCLFLDGRKGIGLGDPASANPLGFTPFYIDLYDRVQSIVSDCRFIFRSTLAALAEYAPGAGRWTFVDSTTNTDGASGVVTNCACYRVGRKDEKYDGTATGNNGLGVFDFYARARDMVIHGNTFDECFNAAVRGKTNIDRVVITGNIINNTPGGISITPNTYTPQTGYIVIANNVIRGGDQWGISVVGNSASGVGYVSDLAITGNVIENITNVNSATGNIGAIIVRYHDKAVISNNVISNVTGVGCDGIKVRNSIKCSVNGNSISDIDNDGIFFDSTGLKAIAIGNLISQCGGEGIVFGTSATADIVCSGNNISDVVDYGVFVIAGLSAAISGNSIDNVTGLSRGIFVQSGVTAAVTGNMVGPGVTLGLMNTLDGLVNQSGNTFNPTVSYGNLAPTTGTWKVGDIRYKTTVIAGDWIGHVCIAAGTPGTWKRFGTTEP